jgi:5-methyltetrahydrofolate--homocysteine methyltransferase
MDQLMEGKRTGVLDPDFGRALGGRVLPPRKSEMEAERAVTATAVRSDVATDVEIFTPPFLGSRVAKGIPLDDIAAYINETALFRNQWGFRPDKSLNENDAEFKERVRPTLRALLDEAKAEGWLVPAAIWGYFPVNADGNDLIVWTDDNRRDERLRFTFPRQRADRHLCISDFFRSVDSGDADYAAFQAVSMGGLATARERELFAADRYNDYLFTHGLSVEITEALAEHWHHRVREEWGFVNEDGPTLAGLFRQRYRGSRYSWGYPACPDLDDQAKLDELLELHRIGVKVTEEFMLEPEQSTSAIIVPHPEAKYFVV